MMSSCDRWCEWNEPTNTQVLEEALLPFLASFPTSRLKLITMYIEQRRAKDRAAAAAASAATKGLAGGDRVGEVPSWIEPRGSTSLTVAANSRFTPIR